MYDNWYKKSYLFVKAYVQDDMVTEDIVSEALVKLWKMMSEKEIEKPQHLLFTLLKNKSLDHLRHEKVRQVAEQEIAEMYHRELTLRMSTLEAYNPEEVFSDEIREIIRKTLDSLSVQTKEVFEMSRFDGLSVKEIAEEKNISPKAVEYHITRAIKALRISLKDYLLSLFLLLS